MGKLDYKKEVFDEHFSYSEASPSGLMKKTTGVPAGNFEKPTKNNSGRWSVYFNGRKYKVHRVIWCLLNGDILEGLVIDHIDGDSSNNLAENLRLVTQKENSRNRPKRCDNKTGVNGIYISTKKHGYKYAVATWISLDGESKWRYFNVKDFPSPEHAVEFAALYREISIEDKHTYLPGHGVRERKTY